MDPLTLILFFTQAAKLANTLAENVQLGDMSPEEAQAKWEESSANWSNAVAMWRNTPSPNKP